MEGRNGTCPSLLQPWCSPLHSKGLISVFPTWNLCPKCPTGPRPCQYHHVLLEVGKSKTEVQPSLECLQHPLCCGLGLEEFNPEGFFSWKHEHLLPLLPIHVLP